MELEEIQKIAIKDTQMDGFTDVSCRITSKTNDSTECLVLTQSGERYCEYIIDGNNGRIIKKTPNVGFKTFTVEDVIHISDHVSIEKISTRAFIEKNPKKGALLIGIFIGSIVLSGVISNFEPIGMALGFILGGLPFVLGTHETKHLKEIREKSS